MKKIIFEAAVIGSILLSSAGAMGVHAACGAGTNTTLRVRNINTLIASQWSSSSNFSGGNGLWGNIGSTGIISGPSTSTTTQTISGNTTVNNINVTSGGTTSTTNVVNTGAFVAICN